MDNFDANELTSVSLDAAVPLPPERRSEMRRTTLLRVGKLVVGDDQRLCMIRNISSAGAMLKVYQPLAVGDPVAVEVTPDCPVEARVIWTTEDLAGVAFAKSIDVIAALRGGRADGPYRRAARTPRVRLTRPARLCTETAECDVTLRDISPNGACVETGLKLANDAEVALFIPGLPTAPARVRWCRDGRVGLEFDLPLPIDRLADWIGSDA
ncbi:PilZ domain-containing protein [Sphingomonas sp.]|uniref:PilZ domain-containing protein n=1 Tax=Sphingomonas sp. TaxID=28214 RepID=UPI001B1190C6|nr:PilZ domain-containing protein [Sphingomonas sp.]MBO9713413.1 PilZ domain-containing protein [Sphingomonas sp.]